MTKKNSLITHLFAFFLLLTSPLSAIPHLHVCALADRNAGCLNQFLDSCHRYDIDVKILGWGKEWMGHGWGMKLIEHYVSQLPDEDLVLIVDSLDLFFLAGKETIVERFLEMNTPFFVSAEKNCSPDKGIKELFPQTRTEFRFINSGTYMGYVKEVKEIFTQFPHPIGPFQDDQLMLIEYFFSHPEKCYVDSECAIAQTLHAVDKSELVVDPFSLSITNRITGTKPVIIHGNGRAALLEVLYDELFTNNPFCESIQRPEMVPYDDLETLFTLLENEPNNLYLKLDLADLYYASKDYLKGASLYSAILQSYPLDTENRYWCLYQIARIMEELKGDDDKVVEAYRKAYLANPSHAEPLYRIGRLYNSQRKFQESVLVLEEALKIPCKKFETYYENWIYLSGIPSEAALAFYWSGRFKEAEAVCISLLAKPDLHESMRGWTNDMLFWIYKESSR